MKNKVAVRIMGQEYIVCSEDSREFIQRVANYVDDKMREIKKKNSKLSTTFVSVLTALNVADDYFKLTDENKEKPSTIPSDEQKFNMVIKALNEELDKKSKKIAELEQVLSMAEDKLKVKNEEIAHRDEQLRAKDELLSIRAEEIIKISNEKNDLIEELDKTKDELNEFINTFEDDSQISLLDS